MKQRAGGPSIAEAERRFLEGDMMAMRPLLRQAVGANMLSLVANVGEFTTRDNGTGGARVQFDGLFTALDSPFTMSDWAGDYAEIMHGGSLDRTISNGCDTQFVMNHDWNAAPMARTTAGSLQLQRDGTCQAQFDHARSDVGIMLSAIEGGEFNAMSFAFWVTEQSWSPDYDQRDIHAVDMNGGDVSVVTYPANPGTTGTISAQSRRAAGNTLLRSRAFILLSDHIAAERRAGASLSAATMDVLSTVLNLIADADIAVDAAQPLLASLMGVPNPDADALAAVVVPDAIAIDAGVTPAHKLQRLALMHLAHKG